MFKVKRNRAKPERGFVPAFEKTTLSVGRVVPFKKDEDPDRYGVSVKTSEGYIILAAGGLEALHEKMSANNIEVILEDGKGWWINPDLLFWKEEGKQLMCAAA